MNKQTLQFWGIWLVLMAITFIAGGDDAADLISFGWINLIISGLILLALEKIFPEKESPTTDQLPELEYIEGEEHYKKREWQEAIECLNNAIASGYKKRSYLMRADCLQELGRNEDSILDYSTAIRLQPDDCNLYFMRSNVREKVGDIDGCISDLRKAIELSRLDNNLNSTYRNGAIKMGWPNGHTSMYESFLESKLLDNIRGVSPMI